MSRLVKLKATGAVDCNVSRSVNASVDSVALSPVIGTEKVPVVAELMVTVPFDVV